MKKIGIVGGISSASTAQYYTLLHDLFYQKNRHYYYPEIVVDSLNFQYFTDLENENRMEEYEAYILQSIQNLKAAGADFAIMAANSPHSVLENIRDRAALPVLSIVDAVGRRAQEMGCKKLLLTGIAYTMNRTFYQEGLAKYGIEVLVPDDEEKKMIDDIIFSELCINVFTEESRAKFLAIAGRYPVDAVILGCTELPLLITADTEDIKTLNTLRIHCEETLRFACEE